MSQRDSLKVYKAAFELDNQLANSTPYAQIPKTSLLLSHEGIKKCDRQQTNIM